MKDYDTNEWITPWDLIAKIEETVNDQLLAGVEMAGKYKINFDLAATPENAKAKKFWTKDDDALAQDWKQLQKLVGKNAAGVFPWLNPPYGRKPGIMRFVDKIEASLHCFDLLPVLVKQDSSTKWHEGLWSMSAHVWRLSERVDHEHAQRDNPSNEWASEIFWIPKHGQAEPPVVLLWNPRTGDFL